MAQQQQESGHNDFMAWFEKVFPELFHKYAKQISVDSSTGKIIIRMVDINLTTYAILSEVLREYYEPNPGGMSFRERS